MKRGYATKGYATKGSNNVTAAVPMEVEGDGHGLLTGVYAALASLLMSRKLEDSVAMLERISGDTLVQDGYIRGLSEALEESVGTRRFAKVEIFYDTLKNAYNDWVGTVTAEANTVYEDYIDGEITLQSVIEAAENEHLPDGEQMDEEYEGVRDVLDSVFELQHKQEVIDLTLPVVDLTVPVIDLTDVQKLPYGVGGKGSSSSSSQGGWGAKMGQTPSVSEMASKKQPQNNADAASASQNNAKYFPGFGN